MRGGTHLRAIRKTEEDITSPVVTEKVPENREGWLENNRLPSIVRDMERLMFESFWRPLRGMGMTPFRDLFGETGVFTSMSPAVDMFERDGNLVVKADLPGLKRDEIEVRFIDNTLEITGEKKTEEKVNRKDYMKLERSYGGFRRTLRLPEGVDSEKINATFKDGVLELTIPIVAESRNARKIAIK